ncbi:MAG: DHA2 family efflux MFS transporter permease subunit [Holosporales bacterium]
MADQTVSTTADIPEPSLQQWIGFIGMVVGMFMAILDIQIVTSSIAQIQAGISATADEVTWIQTSYLIAEVIIIPLTGWLARAFSTRLVFSIATAGFTLLSIACALAWNIESMIIFRALQGLFGGLLIPTVFSVVYTLFPRHRQTLMIIIIGMVVTMAPTLGPVLGGYLTEAASWHMLFLINIIPGIIVFMTTWFLMYVDQPEPGLLEQIDFIGIGLIALSLGCLQYVLEEGVRADWFNSNKILILALLAGGAFLGLIYRELTTAHPIVDLYAFRNFNFTFGSIFSFILGIGLYVMTYLIPMQLGLIKGLSSLQIGFYVTVTGIAQFFSAPVAANLAKILDLRIILAFGMFLFGLGSYLTGFQVSDSGFWEFFWPQLLRGFSLMFCFVPINTIALGTLPLEEVKNASGLYNLMRNLGGAIGLAIFNTWLFDWNKINFSHLRLNAEATSQRVINTLEGIEASLSSLPQLGDPSLSGLKMLTSVAQREGLVLTFNQLYALMGFLFFASLLLIPFLRKVDFAADAPEAAH